MPRKGPAPKRPVIVDPVYSSPLVTSLVNKVLSDGKKSVAERIVYGALEGCREKTGTDPVITLKRALDNVKPTLEVRSRRVGQHRRAVVGHRLLDRGDAGVRESREHVRMDVHRPDARHQVVGNGAERPVDADRGHQPRPS